MATTLVDETTTAAPAAVGVGRAIRRRRSLPNGRAVVGAILVTAAAVGAFAIARGGDQAPATSYLVASRSIAAGDQVSRRDFEVVPIELPASVSATAVGATSAIDGATALGDLDPGELVSTGDLLPATTAGEETVATQHELTLPVDRDRASRRLVPGDRVTVLATVTGNADPTTFVAVEDALVIDWVTADDGIGASSRAALTLALSEPDAVVALAHLAHEGDVTVVRTTRAIADEYPTSYPPPTSDLATTSPDTGAPIP